MQLRRITTWITDSILVISKEFLCLPFLNPLSELQFWPVLGMDNIILTYLVEYCTLGDFQHSGGLIILQRWYMYSSNNSLRNLVWRQFEGLHSPIHNIVTRFLIFIDDDREHFRLWKILDSLYNCLVAFRSLYK